MRILRRLFGDRFARDFSIVLWDGTTIAAQTAAKFTLFLNAPFALRAAFSPPLDLSPGRAYIERWFDLDGDIEAGIDALETAVDTFPRLALPAMIAHLLRLPKPPAVNDAAARLNGRAHSKKRDAEAIGFHYDQPVAFYKSILDSRMVYSCAYWDEGIETLDDAQVAKIDYILRKVRLRPGERLLDIGCGWGALVIRAAQQFGAHALGVTLSHRQYEEAQRRIAEAGVGDRVRVELRDYRDLRGETFDKIVSIGMVEHVGRQNIGTYFKTAYDALKPGGLFLNHGIAQQSKDGKGYKVSGFVARYVFPDGDLLNVDVSLRAAEAVGFEVRDLENLREHYGRTLREWVKNLERNRDDVIATTDDRTYRIWKLYMLGSARNFFRGRMGLFQTLLAKSDSTGRSTVPPTRKDLYARR